MPRRRLRLRRWPRAASRIGRPPRRTSTCTGWERSGRGAGGGGRSVRTRRIIRVAPPPRPTGTRSTILRAPPTSRSTCAAMRRSARCASGAPCCIATAGGPRQTKRRGGPLPGARAVMVSARMRTLMTRVGGDWVVSLLLVAFPCFYLSCVRLGQVVFY